MSFSSVFARAVAVVGAGALHWRRMQGGPPTPAWGNSPAIPEAKPQGAIPTLKMPTAQGWSEGQKPIAAPGLKVNAFARGSQASALDRRAAQWRRADRGVDADRGTARGASSTTPCRRRCGAPRRSASAPTASRCCAIADGDGVAEGRGTFMEGLNQPFGMALVGDTFYVGNTDGVVAFPYVAGADRITAAGRKLADLQARRSLDAQPAAEHRRQQALCRRRLAQQHRRERHGGRGGPRRDLRARSCRRHQPHLRRRPAQPVGLAWEPSTDVLWTVVNERDGLGDETPPDYLTSVRDGGFYGWPYCYWGQTVDDRVPQDPAMVAKAIQPDYALGGHTASLGLCWLPAGTLPGFPDGMVIGQHGSWNRSKLSGYEVVFVPFENGKPSGPPRDILTGFLAPDEKVSYGRPVGVAIGPDGSLLVADDVGNVIWRVTGA